MLRLLRRNIGDTMEGKHFYDQMQPDAKKRIRELLAEINKKKKHQIETIEINICDKIKHQIQLTDQVLKNKISIEQYHDECLKWSEYMRYFFELFETDEENE